MLVLVAGMSLVNLTAAVLILGGAQVVVSSYGNPVLGSLTIVIPGRDHPPFRTIPI
jgi:branched-chain amino acid transport system permease protein